MELIADSLDVDLRWLYGQNVPMEHTSQNNNALQYVFYNNSCSEYLLDNLDDIYIAMMTQSVSYTHLAILFICIGAYRGEVDTVFTKAIRLCLECVGIG